MVVIDICFFGQSFIVQLNHVVAKCSEDNKSHLYCKLKEITDATRNHRSIQWPNAKGHKDKKGEIIFDNNQRKIKIGQYDSHSKPEITTCAPDE